MPDTVEIALVLVGTFFLVIGILSGKIAGLGLEVPERSKPARIIFVALGVVFVVFGARSTVREAARPKVSNSSAVDSTAWLRASNGCFVYNESPRPNESVTWSGECLGGLAHGSGVLQWAQNSKPDDWYRGTMERGYLHGFGEFNYLNDDGTRTSHVGEFVNGNHHGKGITIFGDGDRYDGDFSNDSRWGKGVYTESGSGLVYDGRFEGGVIVEGKVIAHGKSTCSGKFLDWKLQGPCDCSFPNGDQLKGECKAGVAEGLVEYYYAATGKTEKIRYKMGNSVK